MSLSEDDKRGMRRVALRRLMGTLVDFVVFPPTYDEINALNSLVEYALHSARGSGHLIVSGTTALMVLKDARAPGEVETDNA